MKTNQSLWILGQKVTLHITAGDYDMAVIETPVGAQGPPPHTHNKFKEAFLIMEGEMEFFINGEYKTLTVGDSLDVPPGILHTFSNKADVPCKFVSIHSPKGFFSFFKRFGVDYREENAIEKSVNRRPYKGYWLRPKILTCIFPSHEKFDFCFVEYVLVPKVLRHFLAYST